MNLHELEHQTARRLEALSRELAGRAEPADVTAIGRGHFERLVRHATIHDFIPLLVYRCTREELLDGVRPRLDHAA